MDRSHTPTADGIAAFWMLVGGFGLFMACQTGGRRMEPSKGYRSLNGPGKGCTGGGEAQLSHRVFLWGGPFEGKEFDVNSDQLFKDLYRESYPGTPRVLHRYKIEHDRKIGHYLGKVREPVSYVPD